MRCRTLRAACTQHTLEAGTSSRHGSARSLRHYTCKHRGETKSCSHSSTLRRGRQCKAAEIETKIFAAAPQCLPPRRPRVRAQVGASLFHCLYAVSVHVAWGAHASCPGDGPGGGNLAPATTANRQIRTIQRTRHQYRTGRGVSCLGTPTYRAHLHSYLSANPTLPSVMGSTQEVVFLLHACV